MLGSFCDDHKDERLELYCFDCQENICLSCLPVKHSDHKRGPIAELAVSFTSHITSDNEQIAICISEIQRQIKATQNNRKKILTDIEAVGADIKGAGEEAKQMIDIRVKERLDELEAVKEKQVKLAELVEENLQLQLEAAESVHRYSCELLDKARPSDITCSAATLRTRAREVLAVASASYSPPSITFIRSDVNKHWSTYSIGQLVIDDQQQVYKVGEAVATLPEAKPVRGLASLGDHLYLLRLKYGKNQVEEYDVIDFSLRRCLTVPEARVFADMTSCERFHCLYISDPRLECIHRLDVRVDGDNATQWAVGDVPHGLSVTRAHNLLVTCRRVRKIKEFSPRGDAVREVTLPEDVINPWHAIQLVSGQLVVCHGECDDTYHRVVVTSADGQHCLRSHGELRGSDADQYDLPFRLAVDRNQFLFVVDVNNERVKLLSPSLNYLHQALSGDHFKWGPECLYLDAVRRRLYVADNEVRDGRYTAGRVVVFAV